VRKDYTPFYQLGTQFAGPGGRRQHPDPGDPFDVGACRPLRRAAA